MKILFLYPHIILQGRYRDIIKGVSVPPQGICQLAAISREMGHETRILDAMTLDLDVEQTMQEIVDFNPKILAISATTMQMEMASIIANQAKQKIPGITVILGGHHITPLPEETMRRFPSINVGFLGESEYSLKEFLQTYPDGDLRKIRGLIFWDDGQLVNTGKRERIDDLDNLPLPAWDLLPDLARHYQQSVARIDRLPAASVTTSRGCPFQCVFCSKSVYGSLFRYHSAAYVMKMIDYLINNFGIKSIAFEDENFVVDKQRLREICQSFIERKLDLTWSCAARVELLNEEELALMKKAGCTNISFGIESGSPRILKNLGKKLSIEQIEAGIRRTRKAGIRPRGYFIIGSPGETFESIQETIDLVKRLPFAEVQMSFMCPFPGTPLYATASQYGEFDNDWTKLNIWTPVFIPHGLTKEDLIRESKRFYRQFYLGPGPIVEYAKRTLQPAYFTKYLRDGLNILKFLLKSEK